MRRLVPHQIPHPRWRPPGKRTNIYASNTGILFTIQKSLTNLGDQDVAWHTQKLHTNAHRTSNPKKLSLGSGSQQPSPQRVTSRRQCVHVPRCALQGSLPIFLLTRPLESSLACRDPAPTATRDERHVHFKAQQFGRLTERWSCFDYVRVFVPRNGGRSKPTNEKNRHLATARCFVSQESGTTNSLVTHDERAFGKQIGQVANRTMV